MFRRIGAIGIAGGIAGLAAAVGAQTPSPAATAAATPGEQAALKSHVMFLASDAMQGREAGTPFYDVAAQYVAAQFYAAGLRPAGDKGGFLQKVPMVSYRAADQGTIVLTRKGAEPQPLVFRDDYFPGANGAKAVTTVDAPVVFVGYGIVAPQHKRDDFAGVDVKGRIVVFVSGTPAGYAGEERAHFQSPLTKARAAEERGAIGALEIVTDPDGLMRVTLGWERPRVTWARADGTGAPDATILGMLTPAGAAKLFKGAKAEWPAVTKLAATPDPKFRAELLPGSLAVSARTSFEPLASSNVVGRIPGSDPKLKEEVVVLSAHLDHLGVGRPVNGDAINNGALDNAVGVASLIEEAKRFEAAPTKPRRTILFLATTAEEKGLVGADYFARHPLGGKETIVADVNLDMPIITYPFQDVVVFGADHSTLGPIVAGAIAAQGLASSPDPLPAEGIFVRSDHYRFVQQGIPAVYLWPGQAGPGKAAVADFLAHHYHQPSDDLNQPIDWAAGVRFVGVNYAVARAIADADQRPLWNKGDYFGTLYQGQMAK